MDNFDGIEQQIGTLIDALSKMSQRMASMATAATKASQVGPVFSNASNVFYAVPPTTPEPATRQERPPPLTAPELPQPPPIKVEPPIQQREFKEPIAPPNLEPIADRPFTPHPSLPTSAPPMSSIRRRLMEFRESPPTTEPLDVPKLPDPDPQPAEMSKIRRQPLEPPPLDVPSDKQDLRHGFPYQHPYGSDIAAMQLYDEARDDLHNVSVAIARTESDYRRRSLELHNQTQRDLNNDYRQLDELTRRAELSRESITDVNI